MSRLKKTILPAILLLAVYYAVFSGEYSWFALRDVRIELEKVEDELVRKRQQIDSLLALADSVESDPSMLERIARERFGMIRDGETLYRFAEPPNSVRPFVDSAGTERR
jgi:cell division protein FtsB